MWNVKEITVIYLFFIYYLQHVEMSRQLLLIGLVLDEMLQ